MPDNGVGQFEDGSGGAVVLLQPVHLGPLPDILELQDVADIGTAPAVDALVVVADNGDVLVFVAEQFQPFMLNRVGVLIFIDEHVIETGTDGSGDIGVLAHQLHDIENQIGEVHALVALQLLLVLGVESDHVDTVPALGGSFGRCQAGMLAVFDPVQQIAGMKPVAGDVAPLQQSLDQRLLVVGIDHLEGAWIAQGIGIATE